MKKLVYFTFILILIFSFEINATPQFTLIYVVQQGDTLYDIARDYGITVESIINYNNLDKNYWIKVGQELLIPDNNKKINKKWSYNFLSNNKKKLFLDVYANYQIRVNKQQPLPDVSNIPDDKIIHYYVGMGDTLFDLARELNTNIGTIMALNDMEDSIIRVGELIKLPTNKLTPRQALALTINDSDINLLARVIHGEARGEPFIGQVAVGAVVINRVISYYFPDTFKQVIYQSGQFSAVSDGQINLSPNSTSYEAARAALKGTDPTMGSLYYYNPKIAKNQRWFSSRRLMVSIGDHVFTK